MARADPAERNVSIILAAPLGDLLDYMADERGRLDTPEDQAEIARYMRLLDDGVEEPGECRVR